MDKIDQLKFQVEKLITKTKNILNQRKKRSEKLNLIVEQVVKLLLETYKTLLNLISSYDDIHSGFVTTEELKVVIIDTYYGIKNLKDSDKF